MYYLEGTIINVKHVKGGTSRKTGEVFDSYDQIQVQHQVEVNGSVDFQIENIKTREPQKARQYVGKSVLLPISITTTASGTYKNHIESAEIRTLAPKAVEPKVA